MRGAVVALPALLLAGLVLAAAAPQEDLAWLPLPEAPRVVAAGGLSDLQAPGTLVVAAPSRGYSTAEVAAVRAFLADGGRLAVLDPTPAAASLVRRLDLGLEAEPARIFDPDVDEDGRWRAHGTGTLGVSGDIRLRSSRIVAGAGEAVAVTGPFTWRDADGDEVPDLGERRGSFSVARWLQAGAGEVLVLGTPELLRQAPSAAPLEAWLAAGEGPLVLDAGHRQAPDPLGARMLLSGERDAAVAAALALGLAVGLALAFRLHLVQVARRRRRRSPAADPQTLELLAELGD